MQQPNSADAYFGMGYDMGGSTLTFPEVSQIIPWNIPQAHAFNPAHYSPREPDPFMQSYGLFNNMTRRPSGLPFGFEGHHQQLVSESLGQVVHPSGSAPFGLQAELQKLTAQEIMDAKALAASKSHSEAERRRRERINNHLAKLRSLLPNTTKTDKASLLAEVIQHVKELKRQTSIIEETSPVPTETDELTVDNYDEDGKWVIRASICCEDRPDLLPDLIKALKAMRLRTLKAEITTLGGRVKNVLFVTGDHHQEGEEDNGGQFNVDDDNGGEQENQQYCISSIEEALKGVMEKSSGDHENGSSGGVKRQRTNIVTTSNNNNNNISNIL